MACDREWRGPRPIGRDGRRSQAGRPTRKQATPGPRQDPLIRSDEPMTIAQDMNIVVHPTYMRGHVLSWVCDNYLIEASGPSERVCANARA